MSACAPRRGRACAHRRRSRRDAGRRSRGGHRQDDGPRRAHRQRPRTRPHDGRSHRRRHLHREGRGGAEAAAADQARGAPPVGAARRSAAPGAGARQPRAGARQHDSHLLRRPAARTPGRGAGRSAVRHADGGAVAARLFGEVFRDWLQAELEHPREGVRRALAADGLQRRRRADRTARERGVDARRMAGLPGFVAAGRVRSARPCRGAAARARVVRRAQRCAGRPARSALRLDTVRRDAPTGRRCSPTACGPRDLRSPRSPAGRSGLGAARHEDRAEDLALPQGACRAPMSSPPSIA